jgi:hypothetical protein
MMFGPFDDFAPFLVELSTAPVVAPSLLSTPDYSPICRDSGDTRHLEVIATFARECQPSEMVLRDYCVTFYGADRYRSAIYLWRYLAAHNLARVSFRSKSLRPYHHDLVLRDGADIFAFVGKVCVYIE